MAEQHSEHLGGLAKMPLIPLNICYQQLSESCWILCPELLLHLSLAEEPAVHVEAEYVIEHAHAVVDVMIPKEVAVGMGSKDSWRPHLLTCCSRVTWLELLASC